MPPINWGQHLVRHPEPGRVDTRGCTRYQELSMASPPPSTTPTDTKAWERRTRVDPVASLSNFRNQVQVDVPSPDNRQPAPCMNMTLMFNGHYTLSTTQYHAPTGTWMVHSNNSLLPANYAPPPPAQPRPRHVHQGG